MPSDLLPEIEPGLPAALGGLSERQRVVVVMVHAYGWTRRDAADVLEMSVSTIDSHLSRAFSGPGYDEPVPDGYLEADRTHLTDEGSRVVAELLIGLTAS